MNTGSVGTGTAFDDLPGTGGLTNIWPTGANIPEDANSGVFFNHFGGDSHGANFGSINTTQVGRYSPTAGPSGPKIGIDFISSNDGSTYTLMMTENLNASSWAGDPSNTAPVPGAPMGTDFQVRQQTGFVWYISTPLVQNNDGGVSGLNNNQPIGINSSVGQPPNGIIQPPTSSGNGDGLLYSYPSSQHPGGVNMTFCDGHLQFIADDIQYHVYTQLMTPAYRLVQIPNNGSTQSVASYNKTLGTGSTSVWTYLLKETDF